MKTAGIQKAKRIFLFSTAVIVFCLLSIMVPLASERASNIPVVSQDNFSSVLQEEPEAMLAVEDWMLNFNNE